MILQSLKTKSCHDDNLVSLVSPGMTTHGATSDNRADIMIPLALLWSTFDIYGNGYQE